MSVFNSCLIVLEPLTHTTADLNKFKKERIKGTEKASPYTPYSVGNSSRVIFKTIDSKKD